MESHLKSIAIKNFQCHKDMRVKFDPHITSIVGRTDIGKSAVIRALKWVMLNKAPRGKFIRKGANDVRVRIQIGRATSITRSKGKGGNCYSVRTRGKQHTVLKAIGKGVPNSLRGALQVHPSSFQSQHDQSFWFHKSPGEVAKQLNEIVDLGLIDRSLKYLASLVREKKVAIDIQRDERKQAVLEKRNLAWVPEFQRDVARLERQAQSLGRLKDKCDRLLDLIDEIEECKPKPVPDLSRLDKLKVTIDKTEKQLNDLEDLIERIESREDDLCNAERQVKEIETRIRKGLKGKCPVCGQRMKS